MTFRIKIYSYAKENIRFALEFYKSSSDMYLYVGSYWTWDNSSNFRQKDFIKEYKLDKYRIVNRFPIH